MAHNSMERHTPSWHRHGRLQVLAWTLALVASACAHPDVATVPLDSSTFFATFAVRDPAVALALTAPYDTMRIHTIAQFADGSSVSGRPVFTASDTTITVDSTGLVTARFPTRDLAIVRVAFTHAGLTRHDSVQIRVLANVPATRMARVSVAVPPGRTAVIPVTQRQLQMVLQAFDAFDQPVPDSEVVLAVRSSDSLIAVVDPSGLVTVRRLGHVTISVATMAYGHVAVDSLRLTVGLPAVSTFDVFSPTSTFHVAPVWRLGGDTARIAVGGVVRWINDAPTLIDIMFDDPTHVDSATAYREFGSLFPPTGPGNILQFGLGTMDIYDFFSTGATTRGRSFPVPGVYRFHGVVPDGAPNHIDGVVLVCATDAISCDP